MPQIEDEIKEPPKNTLTMDSLTSDEKFPEVKENAIAAVQSQKDEEKRQNQALETAGIKLKKDGTPAKKRGRKAGGDEAKPSGLKFPDQQAAIQAQNSIQAATVVSGLIEQISVTLLSDEWKLDEIEKQVNIKAWSDTFDYYGGVNITPPAALAMSHISIIMTRAHREKTRTKIGLFRAWIKDKISSYKKPKNTGEDNAHADNRADNVGENDVRKEKSR